MHLEVDVEGTEHGLEQEVKLDVDWDPENVLNERVMGFC
jgi:hypothetical protein